MSLVSHPTTNDDGQTPQRGLGRTAARGALLTVGGQAARLALQTLGIVLLARMLTPADFGLVAMVAVVVGLGEIFRDFGLSAAAIRAPHLTEAQRNNLFWANSGLGAVLMISVFALATPLASFYGQPELIEIVRAMSVIFLLNGLSAQYRANLTKEMRFASLAKAEVGAQALALGVGLAAASSGWGYWSLVVMQVSQALAGLLLLLALGRWLPGRPRRGQDMRSFWSFGSHLMASQLLGWASANTDSLVIGKRLGAEQLGFYDRAYRLLMVPLAQIRTPSTTVALPVLTRINDDQRRYDDFLVRGQLLLGYTVLPALAVVVGAAKPLTELFLGPQWSASAPVLALLAVAGALNTVAFVGYWVYLSRSLTDKLLQYTALGTALKVGCILVGSQWGILGVAAGVAIAPALLWPLSLWWLSRFTAIPLGRLMRGGFRVVLIASLAAVSSTAIVLASDGLSAPAQVVGAALAACVTYLVAGLSRAYRRDAQQVIEVGSMMLKGARRAS